METSARLTWSLLLLPVFGCLDESFEGGERLAASIHDAAVGPASVWSQTASLHRCASWSLGENYSTGRFNVHRFRVALPTGGPITVRFARTAGTWEPALLVYDPVGAPIVTPDGPVAHALVRASVVATGRDGELAELTLEADVATTVNVYATGWAAVDDSFQTYQPRTARYTLSMDQTCEPGSWQSVHAGIDLDGSWIPHTGIVNGTLRRTLGIGTEPYGSVVTLDDRELIEGRISWFGGPNDHGVGPSERCAISGEVARRLNSPVSASSDTIASRPGDFYYAAMRVDYSPNGRSWWAGARLLVVNPATGAAIVVRPADWGPHTRTHRIIDLSPQSLRDLDLDTDDEVWVAFALPDTPLGPVY